MPLITNQQPPQYRKHQQKRINRVAKTQHVSNRAEIAYRKTLLSLTRRLETNLLDALEKSHSSQLIQDSNSFNPIEFLKALERFEKEIESADAFKMSYAFVKKQQEASTEHYSALVKKSTGMDLKGALKSNLHLQSELAKYAQWNVRLIKSIQGDLLGEVKRLVIDNVQQGKTTKDLAEKIQKLSGVTKTRAKFIARDQAAKLNGAIDRINQEACGVTHYIWSTCKDERVRHSHAKLEGQVFSWKHPPSVGHPGQDFNCRCVAIPVFDNEEIASLAKNTDIQASKEELELSGFIGASTFNVVNEHLQQANVKAAMMNYGLSRHEALSIISYTSALYERLNKSLRTGKASQSELHFARGLDKALDKMPVYSYTTYRTVQLTKQDIARYAIGSIVEERQFTSTSKTQDKIGFRGNVKFIIHGKTGRDIEEISLYPYEREVLFKTRKRFKVLDAKTENHFTIITLKEI